MAKKPIWERPDPNPGRSKKLPSRAKSAAKASAKAAGRPYPNLIDNMKAAKKNG